MLKTPTKVVSIVPPRAKKARTELKVLDAYVETIRLWSSQPANADSVRFESAEVTVQPWVAKSIHRFCHSPGSTGTEVEDLVVQGVAVIAKCRTDLAGVPGDSGNLNDAYAMQAELMLDAAVGSVVVRELQKRCNALLAKGDNQDAKELNLFQHDVRKTVQQVRSSLSDTEKARASEFARTFEGEPETVRSEAPVDGRAGRKPKKKQRRTTAVRSQAVSLEQATAQPSRFRSTMLGIVAGAMVAGMAAYGVSRFQHAPVEVDASESLTAAVASIPGVTAVQDRMPYILLTVRDGFWDADSDATHEGWVKNISRLVERHGYSGLVIRSTGGTPLAEWVRGRGIKLKQS